MQLPADLWFFQKKLFLHNVICCTLRTAFNVHKTKPSGRKDICYKIYGKMQRFIHDIYWEIVSKYGMLSDVKKTNSLQLGM